MNPWQGMFRGVQQIVNKSNSMANGLARTIAFARKYKRTYDPVYWAKVEQQAPKLPLERIVGWARTGLLKAPLTNDWQALLLDLGDCPEIFHLLRFGDRN